MLNSTNLNSTIVANLVQSVATVASIEPDIVIEALAPTSHFIKPPGFRPNSLFVGREEELQKLHKHLFNKAKRSEGVAAVLIQSIPGGGKTHLARQYVYKHLSDFPGGVFWVTAKSMEQLKAGFWRIAETVALKPSQIAKLPRDPDNFVQCVTDWFASHHEWLLVLDGIHFSHDDELRQFIPDSKNSSLLYTSTEKNVGGDHHFMNPTVVRLPQLSAREAQELFLLELGKKKPSTDDLSEAMKLVQRMGFLPEVIHVAAKRVKETGEPLAKFARAYNQGPKLRALDTFVAVKDQLMKENASEAINLMQIICYFSGNIPVEMISLGCKAVDLPLKTAEPATGRILNNTFKILIRYALIQRNEAEWSSSGSSRTSKSSQSSLLADDLDVIKIHTVVQDFFVDLIKGVDQTPQWLGRAISLLTYSYLEACKRVAEKESHGLVSDFRSYEIQAKRLLEHLDRLERKGPVIPPSRANLEAALKDITEQIRKRTHQSSIEISTGRMYAVTSIFDRTSSSSDAGLDTPLTPKLDTNNNPPGYILWEGSKKEESPVSIKGDYPPAVFPRMGDLERQTSILDKGYDTDNESEALMGSHHSLLPFSRSPSQGRSEGRSEGSAPRSPVTGTESGTEAGAWTTVIKQRPRKSRMSEHRTVRALQRNRYHDRWGSMRAMEPQRPLLPDTAESHETALGLIPHVNSETRNSWLPWPIPVVPILDRPTSRGDRCSGGSAAELALGKISQSSPPPQRRGFIQDRSHERGKAMTMDQLLDYGHRRKASFAGATAGDTRESAMAHILLEEVMSSEAQTRPRSESMTSPRPQTTRAMDSLQKIPWYHQPQGPDIVTSSPTTSLLDKPLPRPPPPSQANLGTERPTAGFYGRPYPVSVEDFHQSLPMLSPAEFPPMPSVAPSTPLYPRRTGPLPIDSFPTTSGSPSVARSTRGSRAQTMVGTQSSPTTFLYPHAQAPYPTSRNRPHQHAAGYSSQPMSRDTSAQSKTSSSGRSGNGGGSAAVNISAPYPLAVTRSGKKTTTGSVGMSPPYGAVGLGIGIPPRRRADLGGRSRASSLAESEPAIPNSAGGFSTSPMGVGRTSYRVFKEEAAYHANDSYNTNHSVPMRRGASAPLSRAPSSPRARFAALVDRTMEANRRGNIVEEDHDELIEQEIFEPRIPKGVRDRRRGLGTMSAPGTSLLAQGEWTRAPWMREDGNEKENNGL